MGGMVARITSQPRETGLPPGALQKCGAEEESHVDNLKS